MKKALITGIGGFVGGHLTSLLLTKKIKVTGFVHPSHNANISLLLKNRTEIAKCDLLDKKAVFSNLKKEPFDYIFHLAAFSSPAQSFENATQTLENNIFCQLNLLEALVKIKSKAKILIVGSSDEYGDVKASELPITEKTPLTPLSPYAVSKVAQDMLGYQFYLHYGLKVVRVRPFNHIGPGQSTNFVVSAFASQIAKLEKEGGGEIKVGNLDAWRDFTDVRDIVAAYHLALEKCELGEVYNVGSGKMYKIGDILNKLISFSKVKIKIVPDKKLFRPNEIRKVYSEQKNPSIYVFDREAQVFDSEVAQTRGTESAGDEASSQTRLATFDVANLERARKNHGRKNVGIYCDLSKFKNKTGWMPKIPITKSLFDTIEYERRK